jgi:hypothetical protein
MTRKRYNIGRIGTSTAAIIGAVLLISACGETEVDKTSPDYKVCVQRYVNQFNGLDMKKGCDDLELTYEQINAAIDEATPEG